MLIGRTDAEAPIVWPPDAKSWLTRKVSDAGKTWRQEEKGGKKDEVVGWHHCLYGHEFDQTPGDSEGQGSLACCSPWGHKELEMTEQLNNNEYTTHQRKWTRYWWAKKGSLKRHILDDSQEEVKISAWTGVWEKLILALTDGSEGFKTLGKK